MPAKKRSITLPAEMADYVERKVASGEYGSESEVLRDGLRALQARDQAVETWLRTEVATAYDAIKADPSRLLSPDEVQARLMQQLQRLRTNANAA
jgi:putative addiction module CopG family antidote